MKRLIATIGVIALLSAACSDDTSDRVASLEDASTTTVAASQELTDEESVLAFTECMRGEGVDLPDPSVDADGNLRLNLGQAAASVIGIDQEVLDGAFVECQEFLEGVSLGFDVGDTAALEDRLVRFAACMRDNGVDLPDPNFSALGGNDLNEGPFGALDLEDRDFQDALDVCGDILAGFTDG